MAMIAAGVSSVFGAIGGWQTVAMIGFNVGMSLLASPTKIEGHKIGEVGAQTSKEGAPSPITWGSARPIGGNLIATSKPRIVKKKKKSGGKGGGGTTTTSEEVYRTYAIRICRGPIGGISRAWRNNKLVYDSRPGSGFSEKANQDFLKKAKFYNGDFEQMPDPALQQVFGVNDTPAHRGTAYMVMNNELLNDTGGAVPQWLFEVGGGQKQAPVAINFALDASGSMFPPDSNRWETLTAAMNTVLDDIISSGVTHDIRVLAWGSSTSQSITRLNASESDIEEIKTFISSRSSLNGTDFKRAVDGSGAFYESTTKPRVFIFITDGEPNPLGSVGPAAGALFSIDGVQSFAFNIDLTDTQYTSQMDNTPVDGVPIVTGSDASSISDAINFAISQSVPLPTLTRIVSEICTEAGITEDSLDVTMLDQDTQVPGFMTDNRYGAYTSLEALSKIFLFDPVSYDGKIHFIPRGSEDEIVINHEDLIDDEQEKIEKVQRLDAISVPRVMHLQYYDVNGGINPDQQTSDRSIDSRAKAEISTETPIVLTTAQAAQSVVANHKVTIEEQKGTIEFSLGTNYIRISAADVVRLNGERLRISKVTIHDGYQTYEAVRDRARAYTSEATGLEISTPTIPEIVAVGDTILHFIDSRILEDRDDRLGYYVAITGSTSNWDGALVELSLDGGQTYISSLEGQAESVSGIITTPIASRSRFYPDESSVFEVALAHEDLELESATLEQMLNRANRAIIGNEIINFGNVDEIEPGVWRIDYLLRGRRGSAPVAHAEGERFVLLERDQLYFIGAAITELDKQVTFRISSFNSDTSVTQTVVFYGLSQTEMRPNYLSARRDGGSIMISWQGAPKLGGGANTAFGQYFTGYELDVNGTIYNTSGESIVVPDPGGSVTIAVYQLNSLTGAGDQTVITI